MKRLFIFASAAIVAFASCVKTHVVYNEEPQEIGFKAVTGVMTKAVTTTTLGESNNDNMGVISYVAKDGDVHSELYFDNTEFQYTNSQWAGSRYWPLDKSKDLDFIVYSPYVAYPESGPKTVEYTIKEEEETDGSTTKSQVLTINVPNNAYVAANGSAAEKTQTDWLYGSSIVTANRGSVAATGVPVTLNHGLAKVSVYLYASEADVFQLVSLTLNNTIQAGTLTVTYSKNSTGESVSTISKLASNIESDKYTHSFTGITTTSVPVAPTTAATTPNAGSVLVFPSEQTSFTLKYKTKGSDNELTETIDLNKNSAEWVCGHHYVYKITLTANEIIMNPSVNDWTEESPTTTINIPSSNN